MAAAGTLLLSGCQPYGSWTWQPASPQDRPALQDDLVRCETYAAEMTGNGPPDEVVSGRDFGGWGNTDLEHCMADHGWRLKFMPR